LIIFGISPDLLSRDVLLYLARVSHELENYGLVRKSYQKLKNVDADLADNFTYLDLRGEEVTRAVDKKE